MVEIVVKAGDQLGECPLWCPRTGLLWWLDILKPALQSFNPRTTQHRVYPLPGKNCGCAALRAKGGFIVAMDSGLGSFDPATGRHEFLCHTEPDKTENRYNDGRCDRLGRFWIGTMDAEIRQPSGSLYRIERDLTSRKEFDGLLVPNSIAFSPDDRTFYFADTPRHIIWAYDFDLDAGALSNRRVFADLTSRKGLPDGSCVDAEGFLWNAEFAGSRIVRYAPDGRVDRTIEVPVENPTCCCFGGHNLDTLYVTSASFPLRPEQRTGSLAGSVLALDAGARGLPEAMFAG
jgi:sugar lactone lactonase YvrE